MLLIRCPHCGDRAQTEFAYGGDGARTRPTEVADQAAWFDFVYLRDNPKGPHREYWQHLPCRAWVAVERDTITHAILSTAPARGTR